MEQLILLRMRLAIILVAYMMEKTLWPTRGVTMKLKMKASWEVSIMVPLKLNTC